MATGTKHTGHKATVVGISTSISVADENKSNYAVVIHSAMANIRPQMASGDITLFYLNVNNTVIYYGIVNKASDTVMLGQMFQLNINATARILFRDSSSNNSATYNVVS